MADKASDRTLELARCGAEVINNPAFRMAIMAIKSEYIEEFGKTKLFGGEKHREKVWATMKMINDLEYKLESMLQNGKALLEMEKRQNRVIRGEFT